MTSTLIHHKVVVKMFLVEHQVLQYKLCFEPSQYYFQSLDCLDYKRYNRHQVEIWQKILVRRQTQNFLMSPNILWHFPIFCSIWMNAISQSRKTPRWFWWGHVAIMFLLNATGGYVDVHLFSLSTFKNLNNL